MKDPSEFVSLIGTREYRNAFAEYRAIWTKSFSGMLDFMACLAEQFWPSSQGSQQNSSRKITQIKSLCSLRAWARPSTAMDSSAI